MTNGEKPNLRFLVLTISIVCILCLLFVVIAIKFPTKTQQILPVSKNDVISNDTDTQPQNEEATPVEENNQEVENTDSDDSQEYAEDEFFFPHSNTSYIKKDDLKGFTQEEVQLARNEIYARRGRKFTNEKIKKYFSDKSWYSPQIEPDDFDARQDSIFNQYEKKNIEIMVEYEKEHGWK